MQLMPLLIIMIILTILLTIPYLILLDMKRTLLLIKEIKEIKKD